MENPKKEQPVEAASYLAFSSFFLDFAARSANAARAFCFDIAGEAIRLQNVTIQPRFCKRRGKNSR
jgi:hypothetical protein